MKRFELNYYDKFADERIVLVVVAEDAIAADELAIEHMQGSPMLMKTSRLGEALDGEAEGVVSEVVSSWEDELSDKEEYVQPI